MFDSVNGCYSNDDLFNLRMDLFFQFCKVKLPKIHMIIMTLELCVKNHVNREKTKNQTQKEKNAAALKQIIHMRILCVCVYRCKTIGLLRAAYSFAYAKLMLNRVVIFLFISSSVDLLNSFVVLFSYFRRCFFFPSLVYQLEKQCLVLKLVHNTKGAHKHLNPTKKQKKS